MTQNKEWPFAKIIIFFLLINFILLFIVFLPLYPAYVGYKEKAHIDSGAWNIILALDVLFIIRMIIAKRKHEQSKDWIYYLVFIALSAFWIPYLFKFIDIFV